MSSFWSKLPHPFFILAPMEAVTDVVFRHVVKHAAAPDVYFTEFTNATGWAHAGDKAIGGRLVKTDDEQPLVAQLWGSVPEDMAKLSQHCATLGYHGIDINMGCPDASAVKGGGGAGMILAPDLASEMIVAAKTSGLPVSVKTRLGYSRVDEWHTWLSHLLHQDIANLTIHLRTKKEMSKVEAHFELISDIKKLRDEIAPDTLLTVNGDIADRAQGEQIVRETGVDGIMIGRGVFHNPFVFAKPVPSRSGIPIPEGKSVVQAASAAETPSAIEDTRKGDHIDSDDKVYKLLALLHFHLDLHDQWDTLETPRKFDPLKRFFKIYIRDFEGAAELRDRLMHTKNTAEVRAVLSEVFTL